MPLSITAFKVTELNPNKTVGSGTVTFSDGKSYSWHRCYSSTRIDATRKYCRDVVISYSPHSPKRTALIDQKLAFQNPVVRPVIEVSL